MIRFNVPPLTGKEMDYMKQAVESMHICGDGDFTKKCSRWIEERTGTGKCLLTTSCTLSLIHISGSIGKDNQERDLSSASSASAMRTAPFPSTSCCILLEIFL